MTTESTLNTSCQNHKGHTHNVRWGICKRTELVRGDLVVMAPAGGRHGHIANTIAYLLTEFTRARQGGMVFAAETGFLIRRDPDTVRLPT